MTQQEKNKDNNPLNWTNWGFVEYQELVQHNTQKTLQFWTDVLNFWWSKK